MFKRKNEAEKVEAPAEPKFKRHICVNGADITVKCESIATRKEYVGRDYSDPYASAFSGTYVGPRWRFDGSLTEAREYALELNQTIQDATRLEGAVASLYPGK